MKESNSKTLIMNSRNKNWLFTRLSMNSRNKNSLQNASKSGDNI